MGGRRVLGGRSEACVHDLPSPAVANGAAAARGGPALAAEGFVGDPLHAPWCARRGT